MGSGTTIELTVLDSGIHCGGCESRIESALRLLPGVVQVKADRQTQIVRLLLHSPETGTGEIVRKLEFLGYQVAPEHLR